MAHKRKNITLYHAVFSPKWRRSWLVGDVATACEGLLYHMANLKGIQIVALAVMPDHVHILIQTENSLVGIARIIHWLKWFSSIKLRERFKDLKPHKAFWARHYFARSVQTPGLKGEIQNKSDRAAVLRYINQQFAS